MNFSQYLADRIMHSYGFKKTNGRIVPREDIEAGKFELDTLELTPDAYAAWVECHDAKEIKIRPGGVWLPIRSFAEKLPEHAARIAGVLAVVDSAKAIDGDTMRKGITLATWYANEALRLTDHAVTSKRDKDVQHVFDRIMHHQNEGNIEAEFTPSAVVRWVKTACVNNVEKCKAVLAHLKHHGYVNYDVGKWCITEAAYEHSLLG